MGAESSAQRDGKSQEDASASTSASAGELSAEVHALQVGSTALDSKPLEKNGQISSTTSLNGHSEDNTLAEVGQPDGVAQKEEASDTMDTIQGDVAPQVNSEKVEKESPDANDISAIEEKAAEEKPDDASEVGFKKIFRFVGFKFTLKKDKSEEKDPVKLLTVKDKGEKEEVSGTDEPTKEEEAAATVEEKSTTEEKEADTVESTDEAKVSKEDQAETTDAPAEVPAAEAIDEAVKEEGAEKEGETALSPFRKLFSGGLFSNLRKKASIKKTKDEEDKEVGVEKETAKTEETAAVVEEKEEKDEVEQETKEEAPATPEEVKSETTPEPEVTVETPAAATTEETKQEGEKAESSAEEEKAPAEVTSEAELLSSQEKAKPQGSPLKKLFAGAGLKKLSTKKQKTRKDTETKLTESGEQASEQLQSSTESAEAPKTDSGPSSPEESGEHVIVVEVTQNESSQETDGEVVSDGEKKKEGIIAWSSFKKLVTPKKRVKRSSESEDEATGEKPAKSATLSSSESAPLADKSVEEEDKEDKPTEEEPKTENTEKLVSSTEEPKKKMDTSVSWEALMCMGGPKKRTRRTSDSDDEETKVEEESTAAAAVEGEQEGKTEAAIVTSQNTESDGELVSSTEPLSTPPDRESTWDTLKRMVMPKNKAKNEEKPEETPEQSQSDSEAPKDESSFSLRKLFPGRRKKKTEKQASTEQGSGEEDSDTPAVVPLSEYDDQVTAEQEAPAEPAEVQIKESAEDRSPSWIPATVEDGDDQHDQLSDIPEEAENAATPKSVDTDIAEDETEAKDLSLKAPKSAERRLSTAEVKPVAPAPSANTVPVPQGPKPESAEEVIEGVEAQISEIPPQTNVTVEDVPVEVVSEKIESEPPTENAESKTITILTPHARDEAMAICTGLDTKEIAEVALEKPVMPIVAYVAVIHDAVSTEVSVEENTASTEAIATEDPVLNALVHQVETTKFEPVVESSQGGLLDIQAAKENRETEIERARIVSTVQEEAEIIQPTTMSQNCINAVIVDPITPTSEPDVCTQSIEVTEPTIETKEVQMDVEQLAATEENTVKEVAQYVTEERASTVCETTKTTNTEETEPAILVVPSEEVSVITETVVLVAPVSAATPPMATIENAPLSESVQVQETKEEETVEETVEATTVQAAESEINLGTEQSSEKMEEIKDVQQTSEIEAQSIVIAQAVIQDAMDKVSEDTPESKKPTTPTPVQAVATTEKEIEITTEGPVITETPVAVCEKAAPKSPQQLCVAMEVIDTIPVEVTESIDASVEQQKPEEGLNKAVEVNISEETVVLEEVVEIKTASQIGEDLEQVREEQSKEDAEDQKPDVKEAAEEVEPQSEETKAETPSEENKEKVLEIHMPVQMVLQTAQVFEEPSVEEEAVEEFASNGPVAEDTEVKAKIAASENKLSTLSEEPQGTASAEVSSPSQVTEAETPETPSGKCAEVMAQVIEVIEEAVKEIEPVSTEITAAS